LGERLEFWKRRYSRQKSWMDRERERERERGGGGCRVTVTAQKTTENPQRNF